MYLKMERSGEIRVPYAKFSDVKQICSIAHFYHVHVTLRKPPRVQGPKDASGPEHGHIWSKRGQEQ